MGNCIIICLTSLRRWGQDDWWHDFLALPISPSPYLSMPTVAELICYCRQLYTELEKDKCSSQLERSEVEKEEEEEGWEKAESE